MDMVAPIIIGVQSGEWQQIDVLRTMHRACSNGGFIAYLRPGR